MREIIIDSDSEDIRIDVYLIDILETSRSQIQKLIKSGNILVNNNKVKNGYLLKENDVITINNSTIDSELKIKPEKLDLDIVYEDDDVIVINKANGMVVHPGCGNHSGTLVNALLYYYKELSDVNGELRPGIVHRLDAYTTGLLVVAKNNNAHQALAKQLSDKTMSRKYYALVWGVIKNDSGTIDAPIGRDAKERKKFAVTATNSKPAITHFKVLKRFKEVTLVEVALQTGRTHQIRVHFNFIGHPVVNDPVYGGRKVLDGTGQCLHAKKIGFYHPTTNEYLEFESELPECFVNIMNRFDS